MDSDDDEPSPATPYRLHFAERIQSVLRKLDRQKSVSFRFSRFVHCNKRRQSDLFNIMDALDLFGHLPKNRLTWRGLQVVNATFVREGIENEIRSQTESIIQLFAVGQSPSLILLTNRFLTLYLFLGVQCINMRNAVILMSDNPEHSRKTLRRLYMVVFVLEQLHILQRDVVYSQYLITLPVVKVVNEIFDDLSRTRPFLPGSIQSMVNRFDEGYVQNLHKQRMETYEAAIGRFGEIELHRTHLSEENYTRFGVVKKT
jgi:hypothetical protein